MSVRFEIPVYGFTRFGNKVKVQTIYREMSGVSRVGGKIFHIDNSSTGGTYTFYNADGEVMSSVAVGDEPYAYSVSGTPSKDKFYVFDNNLMTSKRWTYKSNGSWVYNSLGTSTAIGSGKTNTATVMAADSGAYVTADSSSGAETTPIPTVWYQIKTLRDNLVGGCSDWFLPSKNEMERLRTATDSSGNALVTWFNGGYIWSSSEFSANYACLWAGSNWSSHDYTKDYSFSCFGARAF